MNKNIVIYQTKNGAIEVKGDFAKETIWASQAQIAQIFDVDQSVVSRHIKNIFKDGEVKVKSNMQKMHIPNSDKPVTFYSLDVILAVGYRTNSKVAIEFRKWATKTLRAHILKGYTRILRIMTTPPLRASLPTFGGRGLGVLVHILTISPLTFSPLLG